MEGQRPQEIYNPQREVFRLSGKGAPSNCVCFSVCISYQQQTRKKRMKLKMLLPNYDGFGRTGTFAEGKGFSLLG
jgi:hypothetical protein